METRCDVPFKLQPRLPMCEELPMVQPTVIRWQLHPMYPGYFVTEDRTAVDQDLMYIAPLTNDLSTHGALLTFPYCVGAPLVIAFKDAYENEYYIGEYVLLAPCQLEYRLPDHGAKASTFYMLRRISRHADMDVLAMSQDPFNLDDIFKDVESMLFGTPELGYTKC